MKTKSPRRAIHTQENRALLRTRPSSRRLTVCPISRHPGLVATMQRLLETSGLKVLLPHSASNQNSNYNSDDGNELDIKRLPPAAVFVVDANRANLGIEALIERIHALHPRSRLIVIKETLKDERVFPYLRLGVRGVVRYADAENELANAVKVVSTGDFWISREQLVRFIDWMLTAPISRGTLNDPGTLRRRERQVLSSILSGLTNKEIASDLNISERTVKFYVSRLLQKLGAQRRTDLIARHYQLWPPNL